MPAGDKMIKIMKKISKSTNPSSIMTDVVYGTVRKVKPLTVLVDNRLELTEEFLVLSPFCKKVMFTIPVEDKLCDVLLWDDIKVGERLTMLRVAQGQEYIVLYRDQLSIKVVVK